MKKILKKIYSLSLKKIVDFLIDKEKNTSNIARKVFRPIDIEFLKSAEYEELMMKHLPYDESFDKHEAQNSTKNYLFRHHEVQDKLGVFRWRGIYENKDFILDLITDSQKTVVDFGGAACPLGFDSIVVDFLEEDAWGRKVTFNKLSDLNEKVDVIFSSHTLEHIEPLEKIIIEMKDTLKNKGIVVLHLPSFYCERWRAGNHKNKLYNDHCWTFGLKGTDVPDGLVNYLEIDKLVEKYFDIKKSEYCGDDSIFIIAVKPTTG